MRTGGAEHLLVDLLPALRECGNDVELLLFDGVETPFRNEIASRDITIHTLSEGKRPFSLSNMMRLRSYIGKYDIVHTHNTACQLYAPMAKMLAGAHTPLVTTEHSSNNRRRDKAYLRGVDKWMYARYAAIICIADQPRANLEERIGKRDNIVTIYNGVDTARFLRPIKDISAQQHFVITMVASLTAAKDQDTVIRALRRLEPNYTLQLVGGGERQSELEALAAEQGVADRVKFLGIRTDIPDVLSDSDVIVLSSHWEGLSLSSIEGMASGRPFIASDVDGLREVVGGSGILFPHGNDSALAMAIYTLCSDADYYRRVAEQCQAKAKQYDISVMADRYLALYRQLVRS